MNLVRVRIADYGVLKEAGLLITIGLGSCVGIALYDPGIKVAGLSHILLADSTNFAKRDNPAKFADTAVPLLLYEMERAGANRKRIRAKIAGGSELFNYKNGSESIGSRNISAVKKALVSAGIPLMASDLGGTQGRTMQLNVADGLVLITRVGQKPMEL
jgi:chemotaxis protein CheD